jgi:hypothetical protein
MLTATASYPSYCILSNRYIPDPTPHTPTVNAQNLVDSWHYLGIYGLIMLSTVITVSTTIYYFSIFAGVLIIVTVLMLWYYLPCATKLKVGCRQLGSQLLGLGQDASLTFHLPLALAWPRPNVSPLRASWLAWSPSLWRVWMSSRPSIRRASL